MSLRGRYIIDKIKATTAKHFRLPCPPYGDPGYWDAAYASLGPEDTYEWGDVSLNDLVNSTYRRVEWDPHRGTSHTSKELKQSTSFADLFGMTRNGGENEAIVVLGCGNSRLGEQIVKHGDWRGPVIQVDVSGRVIESMSQRYGIAELIAQGKMSFVQDDATELSAFRDASVDLCLDKGLIDAIHCADDDECQLEKILRSVGRILKPGAVFGFLSFSRPEFLLPKLMKNEVTGVRRKLWIDMQVNELDTILMYRMRKATDSCQHKQLRHRARVRSNKFRK